MKLRTVQKACAWLTTKSKLFSNLLAKWQAAKPACAFSAPGLMTQRTVEILTSCLNYRNPWITRAHGGANVRSSVAGHARTQSGRTTQRTQPHAPTHSWHGLQRRETVMTMEPKILLRLQFLVRVVRKECKHLKHHRPAPVWQPVYPGTSSPARRRPRPGRACRSLCWQIWPPARHRGW